jgi:cytoplasmic iron level regulating protein YaaA (DUF328/UPF0246 family)
VAADETPDSARLHRYWAGDRMTRWQLKVRRDGHVVTLSVAQKVYRARLARQIMRREVQRLRRWW